MTTVDQVERKTPQCVVKLFRDTLGYDYPGDWTDRIGNRNIGLCAFSTQRRFEYLVVHEVVHLIERRHNDFFIQIMDKHLPLWRQHRLELNSAPLAHANWRY